MIPITECRTGAEVRALARKMHARPRVPVVRLPTASAPADLPPPFSSAERKAACERIVSRMWRLGARLPVSVTTIIEIVAEAFEVNPNQIRSACRTARLTHPRQVAMFLTHEVTKRSLPEIGRRFGGRDHTTVLHGIRKVRELIRTDTWLAYEVARLREAIEARS